MKQFNNLHIKELTGFTSETIVASYAFVIDMKTTKSARIIILNSINVFRQLSSILVVERDNVAVYRTHSLPKALKVYNAIIH
jgi:hypothetical protein